MRIDINNLVARQVAAERAAKGKGETNTNVPVSSSEDQATFSESSLSPAALIQGAMEPPAARSERVAALHDTVQSGQYKLDPEVMADAMLKEAGQ